MTARTADSVAETLAKHFARRHAATTGQRRLLTRILSAHAPKTAARLPHVPKQVRLATVLPLAVARAARDDETIAIPVAMVGMLLFSGIDVLDDVMDGELPPSCRGFRPAEIIAGAGALVSSLPSLVLSSLEAPPGRLLAMQHHLKRAEMVMFAGQQQDVALTGKDPPRLMLAEAVTLAKAGEPSAMLASLSALFTACSREEVALYDEIGRCIGFNAQLLSDMHDLMVAPFGKDLLARKPTIPLAILFERLSEMDRASIRELLSSAEGQDRARERVRRYCREMGVIHECGRIIHYRAHRARFALQSLHIPEDRAAMLQRILNATSLMGGEKNTVQEDHEDGGR
jgi:geranylgeranyl pyrophosphate synthase